MLIFLTLICCKSEKGSTSESTEEAVDYDCDPLDPNHCAMPFPSTYFMSEDHSSSTGWRISMGETTLPADIDGKQSAPTYWNERDGWSIYSPALALFPGVSLEGVIGHQNLEAYAAPDAKTVIINAETGERLAHFVELDMTHENVDKRVLMLRPVEPMEYGKRYIVGIRGLVRSSGEDVEASEPFQALRDGSPSADPRVEERRERFNSELFPLLEADGFDRGELQLAWDFVTASKDSVTKRGLWMRDDALERIGEEGPSYTVDAVIDDPEGTMARLIHGTMTVPLYAEEDRSPTFLTRDENGMPYYNGDIEVEFSVAIPRSVFDNPGPSPLVQYGHGLLGDHEEIYKSWASWNIETADAGGYILYGSNWTGMEAEDRGQITLMLATNLGGFAMIPERTLQGYTEFSCLARLMKTGFASDENVTVDGTSLFDTEKMHYYGISQGSILGGGYLGLAADIDRAVLGVGGMPFNLILTRSGDFDPEFFTLLRTMYPDEADVTWWLAAIQTLWDQGEGGGYSRVLTSDPLPGTPAKQVLIQAGIGDAQVPTLSAHVSARAFGAAMIDTPTREIWGLATEASGHSGSGFVEFDWGGTEPAENIPPSADGDAHEDVRRSPEAQQQIVTFFETGTIVNYCDGACDPN
jgi:hypothetical protein